MYLPNGLPFQPAPAVEDVGSERIRQVIRVLQEVIAKRRKFDLSIWAVKANDCNTAACAVGWCCRDPWFKAQGLQIFDNHRAPIFQQLVAFEAIEKFFGLSRDAAAWLFYGGSYKLEDRSNPQVVIDRLERALVRLRDER